MGLYPPLDVSVLTPRLELRGASDDLLERVAPLVRAGKASDDPPPYDDPFWAYETDPDVRVHQWLRGTDIALRGVEVCRAALGLPP